MKMTITLKDDANIHPLICNLFSFSYIVYTIVGLVFKTLVIFLCYLNVKIKSYPEMAENMLCLSIPLCIGQ